MLHLPQQSVTHQGRAHLRCPDPPFDIHFFTEVQSDDLRFAYNKQDFRPSHDECIQPACGRRIPCTNSNSGLPMTPSANNSPM